MRYVDGDKLLSKFERLGMLEAVRVVREAKTLKDPLGEEYGHTIQTLSDVIKKQKTKTAELKARIFTIENEEDYQNYAELERINSELMRDNKLLRESYKELNVKYLDASASATQELRVEIEELNKELVADNEKLGSKESEILILNGKYAKALSEISDLKKKCKTYTKEISKQASDNVHLLRTIERLTLEAADKLQEEQNASD